MVRRDCSFIHRLIEDLLTYDDVVQIPTMYVQWTIAYSKHELLKYLLGCGAKVQSSTD